MDIETGWAAGLFEGEGCLNAYQRAGGKWQVQARLAMTDQDVVRRFAEVMGVGSLRGPICSERDNHKPMYEWYVQSAPGVLRVISLLLPMLGTRRRTRAIEVAQVAMSIAPHNGDRTHCPSGHAYAGRNLVIEQRGERTVRRCRTCDNRRSRERQRRRRANRKEAA